MHVIRSTPARNSILKSFLFFPRVEIYNLLQPWPIFFKCLKFALWVDSGTLTEKNCSNRRASTVKFIFAKRMKTLQQHRILYHHFSAQLSTYEPITGGTITWFSKSYQHSKHFMHFDCISVVVVAVVASFPWLQIRISN